MSAQLAANIDAKAMVHPKARIGNKVRIGAWAKIEADVEIGDHCRIDEYAVIRSNTTLGSHNRVYSFCSIGEDPQHLKYQGEPTHLKIGNHNTFREHCAIHRGTPMDDGYTRIADHNYFMTYVHIGHDCTIGDHNLFIVGSIVGGHAHIFDHCTIGAYSLIHQFCRIGSYSLVTPSAVCRHDIPPYVVAKGDSATHNGVLNLKGLKKSGFSDKKIRTYRRAYRTIFRSNLNRDQALEQLQDEIDDHKEITEIMTFIARPSRLGLMR